MLLPYRRALLSRVGFTLVELMIVVGIIGILATIAIPAFNQYIEKSKLSEAFTNIGVMQRGVIAYYDAEHVVTKGVSGTVVTQCVPPGVHGPQPALPSSPSELGVKRYGDFTTDVSWSTLNFQPTEPLYFSYTWGNGTGCIATPTSSYNPALFIIAQGDPSGSGTLYSMMGNLAIVEGRIVRAAGISVQHARY